MPDKSTTSEAPISKLKDANTAAADTNAAPPPSGPARKIYTILKYGDPILEKPSNAISKFDAELAELTEDMFATMYAAQGIGLAAPQIGKSIRLTVVDVTGGKNPEAKIVLVNPEIIHFEGEKREEEGCLSIPGFIGSRLLPRNRSPQRHSFSTALEHAEARHDPPQNQKTKKTRRVVVLP